MEKTQQSCQDTKQTLEAWIEAGSGSQRGSNEARDANLGEKLAERNEEISQLEQKLELVSQTYTAEIKSLTEGLSRNDKTTKKEFRNAVVEFQKGLEQGFKQEKERSERNLRHSQTAIAALESQLKAVNNHLTVAKFDSSQESKLDQTDTPEDKEFVSQLQQKVHEFERQAKATKELRDKWQRDIETVDALRGQLRNIQERMPQMERFDATLGKVAEVNRLVCSTAQYLVRERGWVQQLHEEAVQSSNRDDAPHGQDGEKPNAHAELEEATLFSHTVSAGVKCEGIASQANMNEALTEVSALHLSFKRKVEVHSPDPEGEAKLSLPPPSIVQEQMRRRGAAQPRSILKLSSLQESTTIEEQAAKMTLGQKRPNRPVMGGESATATSANMVEAIRSGQVPSRRSNTDWSLPRVADFERDQQLASVNNSLGAAGSGKRRPECPDEVPRMAIKKPKLERRGISGSAA